MRSSTFQRTNLLLGVVLDILIVSSTSFFPPLLLHLQQINKSISKFALDETFSCHSPLLYGHLFAGHAVRQLVSGLCGGQQVPRMITVSAQVLDVFQGQGLGLDERLGQGLRFGGGLRRHLGFELRLRCCLLVRLREKLDESLRFGLGLWRVIERLGICWWGLGVWLGLDV